eukprot:gnl/MRDRNA2_/MRDRNA2_113566_c0_seq1.p1 gnl/MRDRNA2_/MRDRNA2_113566_c0~~gnl/MRDRNA2_/MRDRNA2_113566_c0_seq1.p1  ORF type:complete len:714 (-),score=99.27 gnl/MRDRNA2_/MRDRNA2_113566_c0_seq1:19-2160(-)
MHQLVVHRHHTFDELCVEQDYYLDRFDKLLQGLAGVPRERLFQKFEQGWEQDPQLSKTSWAHTRGIFGETVLHWMGLLRKQHDHELLHRVACHVMDREPSLINVCFSEAPYTGESLLHMAVGNSDEAMISELLRRCKEQPEADIQLDTRATGTFFLNPSKYLVSQETVGAKAEFVTPLCVALIAPDDDKACMRIVTQLLNAGAKTVFTDENGLNHSSVLHHLAISRWHRNVQSAAQHAHVEVREEFNMTEERLISLMELFLEGPYAVHPNQPSTYYGLTPLQLAAQVGNKEFLGHLIRKEAVVMWRWGSKIEMRFCLAELDSSGESWDQPSVLELLVAYKHKRMLCHGLFVNILEHKWEMYGKWLVSAQATLMTTIIVLVTLGCLRSVPAGPRFACMVIALVLSCMFLLYYTVMVMYARRCYFFNHLPLSGSVSRLGTWEVGMFRDFLILAMVALTCVLHLWEERDEKIQAGHTDGHRILWVFIDEFTAVLLYFGWVDLLRFLAVFEKTSNIVTSLPKILQGDMVPWILVYMIVLVATAGAMRVALAHGVKKGDKNYDVVGTYFNTVLTLEEATHGPDVSWRAIVMNSTAAAGIYFLIFLWVVTVVLFNILIAMFTDTFEGIRQHSFRERMHLRAVTLITQEKVMPGWFARSIGLPMGLPKSNARGSLYTPREKKDEEHGTPRSPRDSSRWLPIEQDFENEAWDKPLEHSVLW